jgi:hypothetical protein
MSDMGFSPWLMNCNEIMIVRVKALSQLNRGMGLIGVPYRSARLAALVQKDYLPSASGTNYQAKAMGVDTNQRKTCRDRDHAIGYGAR